MRTVAYQEVLWGVTRLLGLDPNRDLTPTRAATLTQYINAAVARCWVFDFFPEWTQVERRGFRNNYAAGEYLEAGEQRYFPGSDNYYQTLQQIPAGDQVPATWNGSTWDTNTAYWAVLQDNYSAADLNTGDVLAVGDQRRDRNTGIFYQVFTAHTATSDSMDTTKAGVLTAFQRAIDFDQAGQTPIHSVKAIHTRNPLVYPQRSGRLNHRIQNAGVLVLPNINQPRYLPQTVLPTRVFVEFRTRPPVFTSTPWVSGTAYDQNAIVYYSGLSGYGQVYRSAFGNNTATVDGVVNWILVPFPQILSYAVQLAATADAHTDLKQTNRATELRSQAETELERVRNDEILSQQEADTVEVAAYGQ